MRFENATPLPAALIRNGERDDRITAFALAALTCEIGPRGLAAAVEQNPLLLDPGLPYPNDRMLLKEEAVSVCATGFVYAPGGEAKEALARLSVGNARLDVLAIGPRVWEKGALGRLTPTSPRPFSRVAMRWEHAFGGRVPMPARTVELDGALALVPGHVAHFPHNPEGMGFFVGDEGVGRPLPLLESPERRIRKHDDWPDPVCFAPYPVWGGLRHKLVVDGDRLDKASLPRLAARGIPELTFRALDVGTPIRIDGMRPAGAPIAFRVPPPPVALEIAIGDDKLLVEPRLDAVDVDAERMRVRLLYRASFGYDLVRYDRRLATLSPSASLAGPAGRTGP